MSEQLVRSFYEAFARRDGEAMAACYHPEISFSDPVFPELRGARAGEMWKMLCHRGKDLVIELGDVASDGSSAHWEAHYTFSATGRKVHNIVDAAFTFRDGKIASHVDDFDFWRWSGLALGPIGKLLGWTPLLKGKVRSTAAKGLDAWVARRPSQRA